MAKLLEITGKAISGEWGQDDDSGTGIPVLRTTNFTNEGFVNYKNVVTRSITKKNIAEKYLRHGDIIIEKSGGSDKQPVGRVIFFEGEENKYLFNNFTGLLRVQNPEEWLPKYVFYALYAHYRNGGTRAFENRTTGLHNLQVDAYVKSVDIPKLSYQEQQHICETLDHVRDAVAYRERQLTKLDELVKARFVEMFGDPKLNPYNFPCNNLSTYITFLTSGSRGWSQYFTDSGEYFITIKNVKNCKITLQDVQYVTPPDNAEAKRTRVQKNDLLISITADLGRTGVVTEEIANHGAYINQHLTCIRLKNELVHPLYVAYYMESDAGKEQFTAKNQSAVKAGLNFNAINSLKLIVSPLPLQNQFAAFVEEVDKSKVEVQKALDQTQLLFDSLMQQYFG